MLERGFEEKRTRCVSLQPFDIWWVVYVARCAKADWKVDKQGRGAGTFNRHLAPVNKIKSENQYPRDLGFFKK